MIATKSSTMRRAAASTTAAVLTVRDTRGESSTRGAKGDGQVEVTVKMPAEQGKAFLEALRAGGRTQAGTILIVATPDQVTCQMADTPVAPETTPVIPQATVRPTPPPSAGSDTIRVLDLTIITGRHEVLIGEKACPALTHTEFGILSLLARHAGWVFTREQIVDQVKGENYPVTTRAVDVQIAGLRKKLGAAGDYIQTVRGVGYRLRD